MAKSSIFPPMGHRAKFILILLTVFTPWLFFGSGALAENVPCNNILVEAPLQNASATNSANSIARVSASLVSSDNSRVIYEYDVVTFRSDQNGESLPERWTERSTTPCWHRAASNLRTDVCRAEAVEFRNESYRQLYKAYNGQGPFRSTIVQNCCAEDASSADRTVQILIVSHGEVISRIQIQMAMLPGQKVNMETHFTMASAFLRPNPETPVVEIGRFTILQPDDVKSELNRKILADRASRERIFDLAWANVADQLLKLPKQTVIGFQVSGRVLERLQRGFAPVQLSKVTEVQADPSFPLEWLVKMNMQEISELQKAFVKKRVREDLAIFSNSSAHEILFSIDSGESAAMDELGVYQASQDYTLKKAAKSILDALGVHFEYPPAFFESYNRVDQIHRQGSHSVLIGRNEARALLNSLDH